MAATQQQIQDALVIQGTYSLISGSASFTDVTNYAGLGIISPGTVKTVLWIVDSAQQTVYKNTGYDAAVFTSPDLQPIAGTPTYSFTLPTTITGAYLQGNYTINMKVQVVEGSDTTIAYKALYQNITGSCNGIIVNVAGNVSYNTAIVSVTDNTSYKTWTALTNTLKLYPPAQSGQAMQQLVAHGSPATLYYEPPTDTFPYTGVWTWTLVSDITYTDPLTGSSTTCQVSGEGNFNVVQSQLCKVYCALKMYRGEVALMAANRQTYTNLAQENFLKAEGEYMLAWAASMCGKPQTEIDVYIQSIYLLINKSPDCDCGCGDGNSQPLVPTSIINGTDGTDGLSFLQGTTVPDGALGVVGDSYLDTTTYDIYKKTGASTWAVTANIKGATGAAGADGANGASSLTSTMVVSTTAQNTGGAGFESLVNKIVLANQLSAQQDELKIHAEFNCTATDPSDATRQASIFVGATNLFTGLYIPQFVSKNMKKIVIDITITRNSGATGLMESVAKFYNSAGGYLNQYTQPIQSVAIDWTVNNTFSCQVLSPDADMSYNAFEIIYYKHKP